MKPTLKLLPVLGLALTACVDLTQRPLEKQRYLLAAPRPESRPAPTKGEILLLRPFAVASAFAGKGFVHRLDAERYASDPEHELFVGPGDAVTMVAERWLEDAGLFRAVVRPGSPLQPTLRLEGDVRALYLDRTDPAAPAAIAHLSVLLLREDGEGRTLLGQHEYRADVQAEAATAPEFVRALDRALAAVMASLEKDLATWLAAAKR